MLTAEEKNDLGVALNEATLLGAEIDFISRVAGLTFRVLTLPESGPPPDDTRVQLLLRPVGRVAASLRIGLWNDPNALLEKFAPSELLETVQSFGGCAVYGWDFFDIHDEEMQKWQGKVSFDEVLGDDGHTHSISLFQEGGLERHLDFIIWFDNLEIRDPAGREIPLNDFVAGGRRWWTAFHQHDPRTLSQGLVPLK